MPILRAKEIRAMTPKERVDKLNELKEELMNERGQAAMGGAPKSPGRIKAIRKTVARIMTIMREKGELK
jgi:large subunit ribosomal protein L29